MRGDKQTLRHKGRSIVGPKRHLVVARFTFADLCEAPLGSLDYQRIAHSYHTLMIEEIPVLGPEQRDEARRLMILIALRQWRWADRLRRGRASSTLCRRRRHREIRPHRFKAHGDALRGLFRRAASAWRHGRRTLLKAIPRALA